MSNINNDVLKLLAFILLATLLGIGALFSKIVGLDFATGMDVFTRIIMWLALLGVVIYFINDFGFRFVSILPASIVSFLLCWLPAFDYWSSQDFRNFSFNGSINYAWYATGWIQALIGLAIITGGHGLIHYLDSRSSY
ncbi:hypothetical protein [Methylomonas fluvii]|uniref:Uncharacterized protein n=1 Tax=Methylomonas fluvii TaxID=1854564 RepID=A0ABR9DI63_9GAMM|nr:hypothetical protein [Methylomonas fluvii]MBD9361582.1 hypothetical protein [Methylomonas fluvii]